MTAPQDVIGVDVAKEWIDTFTLPTAKHERIVATKQALAGFSRRAKGCLVVCEACGGYERPLTQALGRAGTACARDLARATGRLAQTDRVDAQVPTRMGRALPLEPTPPPDADRAGLADLVAMIRAEKNRAGTAQGGWIAREMVRLLKQLQAHLACVAARIAKAIAARAREDARLRSVPGIGPTLTACARKLPTILNAMVRNSQDCREQTG